MALFSARKTKSSDKDQKVVATTPKTKTTEIKTTSFSSGKEHDIILSPHFSEKATGLQESGKYIFNVAPFASKAEIKKAIEAIYKVKVIRINVLKSFTRSKKWIAKKTNFLKHKQAIVTIQEGQKIELGI